MVSTRGTSGLLTLLVEMVDDRVTAELPGVYLRTGVPPSLWVELSHLTAGAGQDPHRERSREPQGGS